MDEPVAWQTGMGTIGLIGTIGLNADGSDVCVLGELGCRVARGLGPGDAT